MRFRTGFANSMFEIWVGNSVFERGSNLDSSRGHRGPHTSPFFRGKSLGHYEGNFGHFRALFGHYLKASRPYKVAWKPLALLSR